MRRVTQKQMEAVLRLDGPARFKHFIKFVVDTETAWGLWHDGWALLGDAAGREYLPLWPAREYAEAYRGTDWADHEASEIDLDELLDELLPKLRAANKLVAVFPTPGGKGVTPSLDELEQALRLELENYEDDDD